MKKNLLFTFLFVFALLSQSFGQLAISPNATADTLARYLVGNGVTVSNATFTGNPLMSAFFKNLGGNNINIDSGIVLTTGRAATSQAGFGVNGNGVSPASSVLADQSWGLPGDAQLAAEINYPLASLNDACILEFDFIPLGDTIRFRYVFSSEEYDPIYVCTYNDAFAFFISGPGITGSENIALIPRTITPVSIFNVNNVVAAGCVNNPAYYIDNTSNVIFTHDGHTTVLTAEKRVQPCQSYHMKLVISDVGDGSYDSGVFVEARSLSSNSFSLQNITQFDPSNGNSYLVEGCATGSIKITRPQAGAQPQTINLIYGGSAINGVDVQLLPPSITIPAGQTSALLNIIPLIDNISEGIEVLNIYTLAPCGNGSNTTTDSTKVQIRDFDILGITPDTAFICRNASQQLVATNTYTTYQWDPSPALSSLTINNPIATPNSANQTYYCTAKVGTCNARDSALLRWKDIEFIAKTDVLCNGSNNGQIKIELGPEWVRPVQLQIGNNPYQGDSTFNNLTAGTYTIRVRDAANCLDSITVTIAQTYPDLQLTGAILNATCTGNPDGSIIISGSGGLAPYQYKLDNGSFQSTNSFAVRTGTYLVTIRDANNCSYVKSFFVGFDNDQVIQTGGNKTICEGSSANLSVSGNSLSYAWFPASTLTGSSTANPIATPVTTTKYYVRGTKNICTILDSVTVFVNPAPVPNAGPDTTLCYGGSIMLSATGGTLFQWAPATFLDDAFSSNPTVVRPQAGLTYTLTSSDANGCLSLVADNIKISVTAAVSLFAGNDSVVAINQPVQLKAIDLNNSGVIRWVWSPVYGLNNPLIANPVTRLDRDITYAVTGYTRDNCEGTDSVFIKVYKGPELYVPKAFTPNNDGRNDKLHVIPVGMKSTKYFIVYNRYGQKVFETTDFRRGWDGRLQGHLQPPGTYVWIAEAVDYTNKPVKVQGTVILLQ